MNEQFVKEILFRYRWYLLSVSLGIILLLFGILSITRQLPFGEEKVEILSSQDSGEITVEIAGAVQKPGVYKFAAGSRVDDLLIAAGGLSLDADREWMDKVLNRAAKLTDGQKIYIPEKTQSSNVKTQNYSESVVLGSTLNVGSLININTASQAQLEALSGIGPVTAQKIIEGRPYSGVEELLTRKILKKTVYEENKEKLSVF